MREMIFFKFSNLLQDLSTNPPHSMVCVLTNHFSISETQTEGKNLWAQKNGLLLLKEKPSDC